MDNIILGIQGEIEKRRGEIEKIKREMEALEQALIGLRTTAAERASEMDTSKQLAISGHFQGLHGKHAIYSFFNAKKSDTAALDEIELTLIRGGAALGRYPKRSIKLAVVNNPKCFSISGNIVRLLR
jgi:hypothetical protein